MYKMSFINLKNMYFYFCTNRSYGDNQDKSDMPGAGVGKTILVTGGGGYIGSHCVHELLVEDYNVVAVDNFVNSVPGKAPLEY